MRTDFVELCGALTFANILETKSHSYLVVLISKLIAEHPFFWVFCSESVKNSSKRRFIQYGLLFGTSLPFGARKTLNGQIPHRKKNSRPSIAEIPQPRPQPPLISLFWSFFFLLLLRSFQSPSGATVVVTPNPAPSAQGHGNISAQCARH